MNSNIITFSDKLRKSFTDIKLPQIVKNIKIGKLNIRFIFFNHVMAELMTRPFQHLTSDSCDDDICFTIFAADGKSTGISPGFELIVKDGTYSTQNQNLYFNHGNLHMLHNTLTTISSLVDTGSHEAFYYITSLDELPDYEKAAPFRMIFHWICIQYNMNLIHGSVIGENESGFLVAGRGGAGKSTISLLSFINGGKLLGDDYVIIDNETCPTAFSLYNSIKVNPDIVNIYPFLDNYLANRTSKGYDKGYLFADEIPGLSMSVSLKINGIIMLTGEKTSTPRFNKIPGLKALSVIGSSTVFQMPGINKNFLGGITKLVGKLDIHEFIIGPSINENVRLLTDFINTTPLISVILPVFNGSERLTAAVDSVLSQTYENFELIIIDDGSTDGTESIVGNMTDIRVKYIHQTNKGPGPARNNGILNSSGRYIAFLDHDDVWFADKLERQLSFVKHHPEFPVVYCNHNLIFKGPLEDYPWIQKIEGEVRYPHEIPSGMFLDNIVFDRVGLFNPRYRTAEDSDLHLRIKDAGINITVVDDVLFNKHIHGGNISQNIQSNRHNVTALLAESIKRKMFAAKLKVSVIIPVYNPDEHLISCIKSVLSQTLQPYEIIVADDGSKNNVRESLAEIDDPRIKIYRQNNKGISGARNFGISKSSGNILAFIDCDDIWVEQKLELQVERLVMDSSIQAVFGYIRQFYSPEVNMDYRNKYCFEDKPAKGIIPGTLLIKKDDFMKVGQFNENLRLGELFDWIHRFKKLGFNYAVIPDIVMYRRLHYNNNGILNKKDRIDFVKTFAQIIKDKKNEKV